MQEKTGPLIYTELQQKNKKNDEILYTFTFYITL